MTTPPITPLEADKLMRAHGSNSRIICGWRIEMDGRVHYSERLPIIVPPGETEPFYCDGALVTEDTDWVKL